MFERLFYRAVDNDPTGSVDPLAAVDPGVIVGPMLIGTVLNVWLYGMQLMQVQTYFRSSPRDSVWIKRLVLFLLAADTANSVFDVFFTYDYNVRMFGDKASIMTSTWVFNTDPVMTVIISSTVQAFFGWRVMKLTKQTWLAVLIWLSSGAQFLAGLGTTIGCGIVKEFVKFQSFKSVVIVWLVLAPVTDVAIALALVWFLQRNKTGFAVTDDLVSRITRLTIQTGAITAVWAAVDLTIFLCFANNLHLIFNMPLSKLYSNCLMSSLNARRQWGGSSYTSEDPASQKQRGIHVTTSTGVHADAYELDARPGVFDGTVRIGTGVGVSVPGSAHRSTHDVKRPPMGDGLSLRSDSLNGGSDEGEDALGNRQKLADEEASAAQAAAVAPPQNTYISNIPRVQIQTTPHPYSASGGAVHSPGAARGGRNEVNLEWSKAL